MEKFLSKEVKKNAETLWNADEMERISNEALNGKKNRNGFTEFKVGVSGILREVSLFVSYEDVAEFYSPEEAEDYAKVGDEEAFEYFEEMLGGVGLAIERNEWKAAWNNCQYSFAAGWNMVKEVKNSERIQIRAVERKSLKPNVHGIPRDKYFIYFQIKGISDKIFEFSSTITGMGFIKIDHALAEFAEFLQFERNEINKIERGEWKEIFDLSKYFYEM